MSMGARTLTLVCAVSVTAALTLTGVLKSSKPAQSQQPKAVIDTGGVTKVNMGDYEPVVPWPLPLPDTHHSHEGWTWGSGAGVWAESPDKVWVAQRGEIELPPGVPAWTCACMLQPPRTNTGRRGYSGKPLFYKLRREHLVFAVDRSGKTINEWHQHNDYLAPPRGSGLGKWAAGRTRY